MSDIDVIFGSLWAVGLLVLGAIGFFEARA